MRARSYALIFLVLAVLAGATWWLLRPTPVPRGLERVRVAQTADFMLYVGLYVAKDAGIFAKHGLDVQIVTTGGDEKSAAAVLAGQAEFGVGDPAFAAIANSRGQDLRFIASVVDGAPFWGVTYDPGVASKYEKTGLRNLRVATFPAPSTAYTLQREMFQDADIRPNIVEGAFGSLNGILEAGRADIALELEPNVSVAQQRGARVVYSMAKLVGPFTVTGAITSDRYAKAHPETVRSFCRSLDDAFQIIRTDRSRVELILRKRFPTIPAEVITSALERAVTENVIPTSTRVDPEAWDRALQARIAVGDLPDINVGRAALSQDLCGVQPPREPK